LSRDYESRVVFSKDFMPSRRDFCKTITGAAAMTLLSTDGFSDAEQTKRDPIENQPYVDSKSLLERQQAFLDLRFGMFLHFNMATFQDREWGDPTGPAEAFDPDALDTDQWAKAALSANMRYACLTTKHHDGFPIWPTKTSVASTLNTPRKIDVVKAYTDSFRKAGLTVGLYYSILDLRNDIRHHNVTPQKIELIKTQLTELLTNYGKIDLLIFDGWDAPWSRITYSEVPFAEIYALVKKLQPQCLISELNASQYPPSALYYSDIKAFEQNAGQHIPGGSDIPAQSCVTLTDGWFWKQTDVDAKLKPAKEIVEDWLTPQNQIHCNLILNAPPNRHGQLSPKVIERLAEIGQMWKPDAQLPELKPTLVITTQNLATGRPIHVNQSPDTVGPDLANDGSFSSAWRLDDGITEGWLVIDLALNTAFNTLVLVEPIGAYHDYKTTRITSYKFEIPDGQGWKEIASGSENRAVRMHSIPQIQADRLRFSFVTTNPSAHIAEIGVYNQPARLVG
jgi:alpha-L-fucosidase